MVSISVHFLLQPAGKAPIYTVMGNITVRLQIKWVISLEWVYYDTIQPSGAQVFLSGTPDKAGKHSP